MFEWIRHHQKLMMALLLLLVFPAFAFFGIQGYDQMFSNDGAVAKVGDSKITRQDFEAAQRQQHEQLRQQLGDRFDADLLDTPVARNQILDGLITQRALLAQAISHRIAVPDEKLRETIRGIPGLTDADGAFDFDRYRQLLRAQGKNEAMFESEVRRDIALQALPEAIAQTTFVPASLVDRLLAIGEQTREVRERLVRPADFVDTVSPTDEQLAAYFERNASQFEEPENARVQYLVLSADAVAAQIEVKADDARAYYEQNKARFTTAEQRRASHILVRVEEGADDAQRKAARARAEAIVAKLEEGADFAALAREESQDPGSAGSGGDLGFFSADMMVKPFADAAFSLGEKETSGVVETEFGFHVIRVTDVRPGTQRNFDSVRPEIESEIRSQQSSIRFAEAAETFSNLVYEQPDTLEPAATRFGLTVQSADGVLRGGAPQLPRENPLNHRRLLAALFSSDSIESKRNTEAVDVGNNTLVSARIVEHRPLQRKPFEAVKDEVRTRLIAEESQRLAVEAGTKKLAALRAGEAPDGFGAARTLGRMPTEGFPPAAVEAVFRAPTDRLPSFVGADLGDKGFAIYQITRVTLPDEKVTAERRDTYRQQLSQAYAQQVLVDYLASVRQRSDVVTYPGRLAQSEDR